jgi:hypothetical protein
MVGKPSLARRWEDYRATKTFVAWSCAGSIAATVILGFGWGGWVRGSTAEEMATKAATSARAELAASICVHDFLAGTAAASNLASLQAADSWKRNTFIEEGGWVTLHGVKTSVAGAADRCAEQLMNTKLPLKAAATSG